MARNDKLNPGIQVFRGGYAQPDVFEKNPNNDCCRTGTLITSDKLPSRLRFDNETAHSNPTGANDKFFFPFGNGYGADILINHINEYKEGFHISVLGIPTYAFVTGISVHVMAEEPGLTFDLVTRNGLVLPTDTVKVVNVTSERGECEVTRELTEGSADSFKGFGALGDNMYTEIIGRSTNGGSFSLEADEIALKVASMPQDGITGAARIIVAVSYDVIHRAES